MIKKFLFLFFIVFTTGLVAQQLGGVQRGTRGYTPPPRTPEAGNPEKPDPNVLSIERADMYQELMGLDLFTKEVLKSYLKDYYTQVSVIGFDSDLKYEAKVEMINLERKKFEKSLKEAFTEEQVEQILTEEEFGAGKKKLDKEKRQEKRKKKKKKKKKKETDTDDGK